MELNELKLGERSYQSCPAGEEFLHHALLEGTSPLASLLQRRNL